MHIGIIGGGTMGLGLAWRLGRQGHQVTVLEAAPQLGGLATWFDYGDFVWDKYYHVICRADEHLLGLARELGIEERVRWGQTRTGFLWDGRQLSMSSHWEFLTFPALSLLDKARLAAGILYCQRIRDAGALERISAPEWLTRIFGARVYRTIWAPLLESKYGVLKDRMPATIMWATIRRYYSTREKGGGRESMGYFAGGLKTFYDALRRGIESRGGLVLCREPVRAIDDSAPDRVAVTVGQGAMEFDRVISTLPTRALQRLAPRAQGIYEDLGPRPQFLGVICLALVLRQPLSPYYVTNLVQKGFPFTGIIGVSNLTGAAEMGGHHLAMLPRYDVPESEWFEREPESIAEDFIEALRPFWPNIRQNVERWHLHRERLVQALWIDGPPSLSAPPRNSQGTLWSVNSELTGRDTMNNNAVIRVVEAAAREFLDVAGAEVGRAARSVV